MRKLTSCCGCLSLKMGTIVIGACGLIVLILGKILHLSVVEHIVEEVTGYHISYVFFYIYPFVDVLLLYGAVREKQYFLLPWIIFVGFGLGMSFIFCLIFMFFIAELIAGTVITGSLWYVWYCVVSFYIELNPPTSVIIAIGGYPEIAQASHIASSVVTYEPQPPSYSVVTYEPQPPSYSVVTCEPQPPSYSVVTCEPQPPSYSELGKGPMVV